MKFQYLIGMLLVLAGLTNCIASHNREDIRPSLEATLDAFRSAHKVPGITAAIVWDNGHQISVARGYADVEKQKPMLPNTPMLAASLGKSFVAATILALAEENKIELDAQISTYLSEHSWYKRLPNNKSITVRHLLTHSSGLPDHVHEADFQRAFEIKRGFNKPPFSSEELVGFILDKPAHFPAGAGWAYTDTGYVLLGLIIDNVAENSWETEVVVRFLVSFKLNNTKLSNRKQLHNLAAGYLAKDNPFGLPEKTVDAQGVMVWNPAVEDAGGGFASTALDLSRWGNVLYRGQAMEGEYLSHLFDGVTIDPDNENRSYGAGVSIVETGPYGPVYGHAGHIPGYVSSLRHYPDLEATIAFQTNTDVGFTNSLINPLTELEGSLAKIVKDWNER